MNNVLCYFKGCVPVVKIKLLRSYCSDFYGSVLWDMSLITYESVCTAWWKGLMRGPTNSDLLQAYCTHLRAATN